MSDKIILDRLWINARIAPILPDADATRIIAPAFLGCRDGVIACLGEGHAPPAGFEAAAVTDCGGRLMTPGLVDCHTHLVFGGHRAHEFEMRLKGASYAAIAAAGGGILSTVRATRGASVDALVAAALPRLDALLAEGVTTLEIKSGYGLDQASELNMLRAARRLGLLRPVRVVTSFLGAHALPPEAEGDKDRYIDLLVHEMLPAAAAEGLVDAVDGFCETIAFTPDQCARLFDAAHRLGLPVKLHADQLTNGGGAALSAQYGALSADHLEYADEAGARVMAEAKTVAVLLPGAYYFLRERQAPPVDLFRAHGVRMALATDCNPGSSPLTSLLLAANMGATLFRMTVDECLAGITRVGAEALGLGATTGSLAVGKACDLALWEVEQPAELVYRIGFNPLFARVFAGQAQSVTDFRSRSPG